MNDIEVERYLDRIKFTTKPGADLPTLKALQKQHLLTVPFENLDIHLKIPITLDAKKFYDKVVNRRRGGFCYELNALFNELLKAIGFKTTLISARAFNAAGKYGEEFDHLAILVETGTEKYLADVGFGEFALTPLKLITGIKQVDERGTFIIERFNEQYFIVRKAKENEKWDNEYLFSEKPHHLPDFETMCNFHQHSSQSHFTQGMLCSIATPGGRTTLTNKMLKITEGAATTESLVNDMDEFQKKLEQYFNINLKF